MEFTQIEVARISEVAAEATEPHVKELNDLQLTFVGGGCGEVTFN